jgi:hypothetical protein
MKKLLRLTAIMALLTFGSCATMWEGYKMEDDLSAYGKPDNVSYFGNDTRTYTWYCAGGMYRSYTYKLQLGGHWVRTGVYHSNCIK